MYLANYRENCLVEENACRSERCAEVAKVGRKMIIDDEDDFAPSSEDDLSVEVGAAAETLVENLHSLLEAPESGFAKPRSMFEVVTMTNGTKWVLLVTMVLPQEGGSDWEWKAMVGTRPITARSDFPPELLTAPNGRPMVRSRGAGTRQVYVRAIPMKNGHCFRMILQKNGKDEEQRRYLIWNGSIYYLANRTEYDLAVTHGQGTDIPSKLLMKKTWPKEPKTPVESTPTVDLTPIPPIDPAPPVVPHILEGVLAVSLKVGQRLKVAAPSKTPTCDTILIVGFLSNGRIKREVFDHTGKKTDGREVQIESLFRLIDLADPGNRALLFSA